MEYRFVVRVGGKPRNFLKLTETPSGDLVISQRGRFYSGKPGIFSVAGKADELTNITVHPNLKSRIGSITVNYKRKSGKTESRKIAHVLGVKHSDRLFPVYASIGRNLHSRWCDVSETKAQKAKLIELWPSVGLDQSKDSLAFMLFVANRQAAFTMPGGLPCNFIPLLFARLQVLTFFWLFNRPTKPYWSNFVAFADDNFFGVGMEFHEAVNYTNDLTLLHATSYDSFPTNVVRDGG